MVLFASASAIGLLACLVVFQCIPGKIAAAFVQELKSPRKSFMCTEDCRQFVPNAENVLRSRNIIADGRCSKAHSSSLSNNALFSSNENENRGTTKADCLPLNAIFNRERTFLFTAQRNVRSFEWTREELEDLWDLLTSFSDKNEQQQDQYPTNKDEDRDEIADLGVIMVVEHKLPPKDQEEIGAHSKLYDVR
jgi:hypothetical protein